MRRERRHVPRESTGLPVLLIDGRRATIRNMSPDGLYLFVPHGKPLEGSFAIELRLARAGLAARAIAEVLRTEPQHGGAHGIAVRLHAVRVRRLG